MIFVLVRLYEALRPRPRPRDPALAIPQLYAEPFTARMTCSKHKNSDDAQITLMGTLNVTPTETKMMGVRGKQPRDVWLFLVGAGVRDVRLIGCFVYLDGRPDVVEEALRSPQSRHSTSLRLPLAPMGLPAPPQGGDKISSPTGWQQRWFALLQCSVRQAQRIQASEMVPSSGATATGIVGGKGWQCSWV